jgi:hypothetical protein
MIRHTFHLLVIVTRLNRDIPLLATNVWLTELRAPPCTKHREQLGSIAPLRRRRQLAPPLVDTARM